MFAERKARRQRSVTSTQETVEERIATAITRFEIAQMATRPESVSVALRPNHVVATLEGVACPAERDYSTDAISRRRLDELHARTFEAAKMDLENEVAGILGREVSNSSYTVDPQTGSGVILLALAAEPSPDSNTISAKGVRRS